MTTHEMIMNMSGADARSIATPMSSTHKKKSIPVYVIYDQFENCNFFPFTTKAEAITALSEMDNPTKKLGSKTLKRYVVKEV